MRVDISLLCSRMKEFEQLRIVFFGTPDFAVASLDALVRAGACIVAVVTAPDKPAGRGMHLQMSAVKQYALEAELPVLQPEKMKSPEFLAQLQELHADLQVVVAFRMMPEVVWNMPPLGTINVHGSLLPDYRGAAPINWAIMNGDKETGVTTFKLKHEIDTGDILLQQSVEIADSDNAGQLHDKLMRAGAELLVKTVRGLAAGQLHEVPQNEVPGRLLRHAPKLFKEHMLVDWGRPVSNIRDQVRGLSPYPGAFTMLQGKTFKLYQVRAEAAHDVPTPGNYETDQKTYLRFAGADGWVYADEVQMEGKKRMPIAEFLRGFRG